MCRTLWIAIVFMGIINTIRGEVSIQYADCPDNCTCEKRIMSSVLSCNRLLVEQNEVADMPISKFELSHTDSPLRLTENLFLNIGLTHVNVISISNTEIEYIDKSAFNELNELTHIIITHSKITHLHPDTFKNITHLKKLNLDGNPINSDIIIASSNLEELRLAHCGLNKITSKMFEQIPKLTLLNLTGNGIEILPADVFNALINIEEINLSHNKIKNLPNGLFAKNEIIDVLDLSYNPITSFSGENITSLETLNLKACLLSEVHENMFKNMNLLYNLDLSNNKIVNIHPKAFSDLIEIATINLSYNELIFLNENLFVNNTDLQKLNFDGNVKLNKLPVHGFKVPKPSSVIHYFRCNNCNLKSLSRNTFRNMPNLLTLFLSHNRIEDISTGVFQNLTSLIELDLSHNQIITIDDETFKKNSNLNKINLSHNTLKSLHATIFKYNVNLKYLDISYCGLYQLWTGKSTNNQIPSIISINASNNNIDLIKKEDIAVTNRLRSLDISNNKLYCTENLRDLILYLQSHDIKNIDYTTHEKQSYDLETRERDETSWKQFAKNICPTLLNDDEEDDIDEDEYEESMEPDNDEYDNDFVMSETTKYNDDLIIEDIDRTRPLKYRPQRFKYIYMWPVLLFLGTAMIVLGFTANTILFFIRRRNAMPVPSIMNVPRMSRLKKNSGLVYQQLSEEHGPKTPILNRFIAPVPISGICGESEHV